MSLCDISHGTDPLQSPILYPGKVPSKHFFYGETHEGPSRNRPRVVVDRCTGLYRPLSDISCTSRTASASRSPRLPACPDRAAQVLRLAVRVFEGNDRAGRRLDQRGTAYARDSGRRAQRADDDHDDGADRPRCQRGRIRSGRAAVREACVARDELFELQLARQAASQAHRVYELQSRRPVLHPVPRQRLLQACHRAGQSLLELRDRMVIAARSAADLLHEARGRELAACIPEAIRCYETSISAAERSGESAILAEALRRLAIVIHHRNESARAHDLCNRSYKLACALENDVLAAEALNTMGGLALRTGALEEARTHFLQALDRGGQARELLARVEQNLGILANIRGELVDAVRHYERAVESYRATNDEHGSATAYVNLGIAHTDLRQFDWADSYFSKSFEIAERAGDVYLQGTCLVNHAEAQFMRGRYDEARRMAEAALAIFDQLDSPADKSEAYKIIGMVYREPGRPALGDSRSEEHTSELQSPVHLAGPLPRY